MRTTIDIRDELLARAKQAAATQHRRLSDLVNDGLLTILERSAASEGDAKPFRVRPFKLGPTLSGIDLSDSGSLLDAMGDSRVDPQPDPNAAGKFK